MSKFFEPQSVDEAIHEMNKEIARKRIIDNRTKQVKENPFFNLPHLANEKPIDTSDTDKRITELMFNFNVLSNYGETELAFLITNQFSDETLKKTCLIAQSIYDARQGIRKAMHCDDKKE